jgi:hypothetical protein
VSGVVIWIAVLCKIVQKHGEIEQLKKSKNDDNGDGGKWLLVDDVILVR